MATGESVEPIVKCIDEARFIDSLFMDHVMHHGKEVYSMSQEELKKKVNRPVRELPLAEEADLVGLKGGRDGNGNGHPPASQAPPAPAARPVKTLSDSVAHFQQDAPACPNCGHVTVRNGACYKCLNCGESLGCS